MIHPPGPTPKRPRSDGRRRPRTAWSRPRSARTRDGPTPARSGGSTPGSTGASSMTRHWRPTSPSCTTPAGPPRAPRCRSPRRASAQSSQVNGARLASGRPGCSPATGGPPPIAAAARRARSAPPTSRPCSPRATAHAGAGVASSPTRWLARKHAAATAIEALYEARPASCSSATGRGGESEPGRRRARAARCGDAGLLFMAGMRRAEISR